MAYIQVDHSKFEVAASSVDAYVDLMKSKMGSAQGEINTLSAAWQGTDFTQFETQWNGITNSDSAYMQMVKTLESYAEFLRFASAKYKEAQVNAVNRANGLPRY